MRLVTDLSLDGMCFVVQAISTQTDQYSCIFGGHPLLELDTWSTLKLSVKDADFILSVNGEKIVETGDDFNFVLRGQAILEQRSVDLMVF